MKSKTGWTILIFKFDPIIKNARTTFSKTEKSCLQSFKLLIRITLVVQWVIEKDRFQSTLDHGRKQAKQRANIDHEFLN